MSTDLSDLIERAERFLVQCGICDFGLPVTCTCPDGDPRAVIADLVAELRNLTPVATCTAPVGAHQHSASCRAGEPS